MIVRPELMRVSRDEIVVRSSHCSTAQPVKSKSRTGSDEKDQRYRSVVGVSYLGGGCSYDDRSSHRRGSSRVHIAGHVHPSPVEAWIIEDQQTIGGIPTLDLVSVEDDSQGETLRIALPSEIGAQVLDPNDWSPLLQTSVEGPERLGAYLRATEWRPRRRRTASSSRHHSEAGIRLDAYQQLPLAKALELPRDELPATRVGKTIGDVRQPCAGALNAASLPELSHARPGDRARAQGRD